LGMILPFPHHSHREMQGFVFDDLKHEGHQNKTCFQSQHLLKENDSRKNEANDYHDSNKIL